MTKVAAYQNGMANAYLLIGKGVIAVDTGSAEDEKPFLRACAANGVRPGDVNLIVITHGHCDHFQNLPRLKQLTGAPALCHKNAAVFLRNGLWPNKIARTWVGRDILRLEAENGMGMDHVARVEPDILVDSVYSLHPWGVDAKVIPVKGHSEGDLAILTDGGDVIAGDLYAQGPGYGRSGPAFFMGPGDEFSDAVDSVEALLKMGGKTFWSGHGGPFSRREVAETTAEQRLEGPAAVPRVPNDIHPCTSRSC